MLIAQTMTMLTEGDKALALATAGAHRSMEREKRLWAQERKDWKMCCLQLDHAHEAYAKAVSLPSYEPQIRARLGTAAHFCEVAFSSCLIPSSCLSRLD